MGKNNKIVNICNQILHDKVDQIVPCAFGSFIITLYEDYNWSYEELEELLNHVQAKWDDAEAKGIRMDKYCEEKTGVMLLPSTKR